MTQNDRASAIGPFKRVPEEVRLRIAAGASAAADKALALAIRSSREAGDEGYAFDAVFQGTAALNAAAGLGFRHSSIAADRQWTNLVGGATVGFVATGALFAPMTSMTVMAANPHMGGHACAVLYGLLCAAGAAVTLGALALGPLGAIRRARRQGFYHDILPEIVAEAASTCWLLCETSLQITEADEDGVSARTVFYDAIGAARVAVNAKGEEAVEITGRDGPVIATISWPTGDAIVSAHGLAASLTEKAAAARKAA